MNEDRPDIVLSGPNGRPIAQVEVKNLPRLTESDAIEFRRELIRNGRLQTHSAYFLVVSQEHGYLWGPNQSELEDEKPAQQFEMDNILREYLTDIELDRRLRGSELELVIMHWLSDVARGKMSDAAAGSMFARFLGEAKGSMIEIGELL